MRAVEHSLQAYFQLTSLLWKDRVDLEGITGFALGNVLDAMPVLMDKRRND